MKKKFTSLLTLFSFLFVTAVEAQPNTFPSSGFVGIGTTSPQQRLHVEGGNNQAIFVSTSAPGSLSGSGMIGYAKGLPTAAGHRLGYFLLGSRGGANFNYNVAGMIGYAESPWTAGSSHPAYLAFETTSSGTTTRTERMRISGNGNVGIGTVNPQTKLHVFNSSAGVLVPHANSHFVVENNTDNYISVLGPDANEKGIFFGDPSNVRDGGIIYAGSTNSLLFRTNGNTNRMSLSSTGDLTIRGNLDISGTTITFGTVETFADAGANMISSNSDLIPSIDNSRRLGTSALRWSEVWAADGTINTSDAREKTNVRDLEYGIATIMKLRPTKFNWKGDQAKSEKIGLIAQEVQEVLPEVVRSSEYKYNEETGIRENVPSARLGIAYADLIPLLISGMQEQQAALEGKDLQLNAMQLQLVQLQSRLEQLVQLLEKKGIATSSQLSLTPASRSRLLQNSPNPFTQNTTLRYFVPDDAENVTIHVLDAKGAIAKTYSISQKGSGQLIVHANELAAGIYTYSLFVNGSKVDTRQMVLTR